MIQAVTAPTLTRRVIHINMAINRKSINIGNPSVSFFAAIAQTFNFLPYSPFSRHINPCAIIVYERVYIVIIRSEINSFGNVAVPMELAGIRHQPVNQLSIYIKYLDFFSAIRSEER